MTDNRVELLAELEALTLRVENLRTLQKSALSVPLLPEDRRVIGEILQRTIEQKAAIETRLGVSGS